MIDKHLIKRLKENDESAFKELVHQHSFRLMTVAKVYTHSLHDAQDVLQDALIIVFEKISNFKGDNPAAFYGWMKKITINRALGLNRKKFKSMESSLEGYSHKEIAKMLEIQPSTSRSQFTRAKAMLKRELEQLYKIAI